MKGWNVWVRGSGIKCQSMYIVHMLRLPSRDCYQGLDNLGMLRSQLWTKLLENHLLNFAESNQYHSAMQTVYIYGSCCNQSLRGRRVRYRQFPTDGIMYFQPIFYTSIVSVALPVQGQQSNIIQPLFFLPENYFNLGFFIYDPGFGLLLHVVAMPLMQDVL